MTIRQTRLITAMSLVAAVGFGLFAWSQLHRATTVEESIAEAGLLRLQATTMTDVEGKTIHFTGWQGRVLIVNFWATWCPPCRKEMPAFSRIHNKFSGKGVQFVGIGVDSPSAIKEFALQFPVSYPLLLGGSEGLELTRALGNSRGGLPHTVIFGRDGQPILSRLGVIDESELESLLTRLTES